MGSHSPGALRGPVSRVGFVQLLRQNATFRRLFTANEISFVGDWFTVIALFLLAGEATDNSPLAIAGVLAARSFTFAPLEPFTGMLADRYSRKALMLMANLSSFVILVAVLSLDLLGSLASVYALAVAMVVGRAVFDPSEYAYLPNICDADELLTANALASGGWSVALGVGAGIGGLTISAYGIETALWIDTLTFLAAALLITTLPEGGPDTSERTPATPRVLLGEIWAGWRHILANPPIRRVVLAKGMWASGGGAQVFLLVLIGMSAGFGNIAAGIGILYMARGFGSGFGPVVGRPLMANRRLMPYLLGLALGGSGLFYLVVAASEWTRIILVFIFLSHASSGINWVLSTTMLQERAADEWRGRVAGTDNLGITLTMGISALAAGLVMEHDLLALRELIALTGLIQISVGLIWLVLASPHERRFIAG